MILTREQAKAIREADTVCFDYAASDGGALGPAEHGTIRAIYRANDSTGRSEVTVTIPRIETRITCYDGATVADCFDMVMLAQHTPEWRTVAKRLKAGTDIRLHWVRGNSSPVTDEAGLVVDYLNVVVNGDHYRIGNYVGRDNTARFVRVR